MVNFHAFIETLENFGEIFFIVTSFKYDFTAHS